ncbi:hypothetical protein BK789_23510 [Bacillus thuringiensis serovar darmstadiensis]|nr:hypothetical protein BK789_23510 [Bacillus thuringiensis serovar darmstadiensis]
MTLKRKFLLEGKNLALLKMKSTKKEISPKRKLGLLTSNNEYWFITEDGIYKVPPKDFLEGQNEP